LPANQSSATATVPTLERIGTRDDYCAPNRADGCARACVTPPVPWSGVTPTFGRAELWAHIDSCPDAALRVTTCTLAVLYEGVWYVAFEDTCVREAGPAYTKSLEITGVTSHGDVVTFDYRTTGSLEDASPGPNGNHIDSEVPVEHHLRVTCHGTSCDPAVLLDDE
jgi:hypothetical protein